MSTLIAFIRPVDLTYFSRNEDGTFSAHFDKQAGEKVDRFDEKTLRAAGFYEVYENVASIMVN